MRNRIMIAALILTVVVLMAGIAVAAAPPHGGWDATTSYCKRCHKLHEASGIKLLARASVYDTCRYCHSAGSGLSELIPYDLLPAGNVKQDHTADSTTITSVPGGALDGGASYFSCASCHSPHDNNTVAAFTDDETWSTVLGYGATSHLLKNAGPNNVAAPPRGWTDLPGVGTTAYSFYGAGWCADCHNRRMTGGTYNNHPISNTRSYAAIGLAMTNNNFHLTPASHIGPTAAGLPYIRSNVVCQSCHEDFRNADNPFNMTTNPRYKDFPHETEMKYFKVEGESGAVLGDDDLCLNCHAASNLP